ncbi:MAG TPA: hypothetical protein VNO52_15020, partial [Methylomirabilota bacterium]|nr:hypothetical protein [Methylomirabilota bacterium]
SYSRREQPPRLPLCMKSDFPVRSIVVLFVAVLACYLAAFYGWEHWQHRLGPWTLEFTQTEPGDPVVIIRQPSLGIADARLVFLGESTSPLLTNAVIRFDQVRRTPPFGRMLYEDLRSFPGIVTLDLFGHEIELRPRELVVNGRALSWQTNRVIALRAADKPARPPQPPAPRRKASRTTSAGPICFAPRHRASRA